MFQHLRRAVGVMLAALVMLAAPQVAHAAFSGQAAPQMQVGTARMVELTNLSGNYTCQRNGNTRSGINVTINSFDDAGPAGSSYEFVLSFRGQVLDSRTTSSRSGSLSVRHNNINSELTYTLSIQASLSGWTGPALTRSLTC